MADDISVKLSVDVSALQSGLDDATQAVRDACAAMGEGFSAAGEVANAQKLSQLHDLVEQEDGANYAALADSIKYYDDEAAGFRKVCDQIAEAKEELRLDLAATDHQISLDAQKGAKEQTTIWEKVDQEILSSEDGLVRDLLTKRRSLGADLLQIAGQMAEKELASDLRLWTQKVLIAVIGKERIQATEKGGLLWNILFGQQDVAQTESAETGKTAAVAQGVGARTAIKAGGAAASNATELTSDKASILNSAYTSAAEAFKSVMQSVPPPANLVLAPVAAAGTFTAVMAYDSLTALDVGAWELPGDMPAMLHKGEMVVPENFASGLRASRGAAGGDGVVFNTHYYPTINMREPNSLKDLLQGSGAELFDAIQRGYRTGLPLRPSMRTL